MDRALTLETVRLTEAAALYANKYMGKGDENAAYQASIEAMYKVLASMNIEGEVIIGAVEGSRLSAGSFVGITEGMPVDLALKPLDGKKTCARGGHNAVSVAAVGSKGAFLSIPPLYMEKIAVGREAKGVVDINQPPEINIKRIARAKKKYIEDITVCVLDRKYNEKLVSDIRKTGAKIQFIRDGDISGAIAPAFDNISIDMLMGIGGAKEAVIAAAALKCLDGDIQARFFSNNSKERSLAAEICGGNPDKIFTIRDMVKSDDVMVSLTGVTDGVLLQGVQSIPGGAKTTSILLRQKTHTLRFITAVHQFDFKPLF